MTANQITADLLLAIPKRFGDRIWLYRNNRLVADAIGKGGKTRKVSAGIDGQADLSGTLSVEMRTRSGEPRIVCIRCEVEVKADCANGRRDELSVKQHAFRAKILKAGGVYITVRDVETGLAELAALLESY